VIPGSGIDLVEFAPAKMPEGPTVFLMIGRVLRDKGVLEYVQAARTLKASHPHLRFQLLGAAGAENRTAIDEATVMSWVNEGTIEYLGTTNDVRAAIEAASCIVLPSYREGAPRTLIEGAAMARPLIATDVPGCRTVVDHGSTGYLVAVRDAASLAAAMEKFSNLTDDEQENMGMAGNLKMQNEFDKDFVVSAYLKAIG
jgi:glycosyltransferase involved in cell wall biosynthesis